MKLEYQIIAAIILDLLIGDPRRFPHPVKLIGRLAAFLETPFRKIFANQRIAGICEMITVLFVTGVSTYAVIKAAGIFHPFAADIVSVIVIYSTFAARDLAGHAYDVYKSLNDGNLVDARRKVSLMVGRDTQELDEREVVRATVESVAENTVDGVTAPLFFAVLAGPVGAMIYKAINTLDSTFGYKNERYIEFGWASAKIDDLANFIPARITAILVPVAAMLMKLSPTNSIRVLIRDRKNHPSPNSGHTEAAMAGALGIQMGGLNYYFGKPSIKPSIGDSRRETVKEDIIRVNVLMLITFLLCVFILLGSRAVVL